jgi:PTS system mannose-specific IID component
MIGGGIAYALWPLLTRIHAGDPVALRAALERHASAFNAHPYLSSLAVGALARIEYEEHAPETIEQFRTALRGPLGAIGDQAVWAGWRPFCLLTSILAFCLGLDARAAALGFLLLYNSGHLSLRAWGYRRGWREGLNVGGVLTRSPLKQLATRLVPVNQALMGAAVALLLVRLPIEAGVPEAIGGAVLVGFGAYFLPSRGAVLAMSLLFGACLTWII